MLIRYIKKRDGRAVLYDRNKIANAVRKAAVAAGSEFPETEGTQVASQVEGYLKILFDHGDMPAVEQIQDLVERILMEKGFTATAKAYILYRQQHAKLRDAKKLMSNAADIVTRYIDRIDWKVNENSNMSYSLQGLNNYIASEITSHYWLEEIYPPEIREAHQNADFHIHDLSLLAVYCCGWDLTDLLRSGFTGVATKISARPPKHLRSALGQVVNFFYTLQGEAAGAQAFASFDTCLAPYVRRDGLDYEAVRQAMQEFVFNLNVPTRVGFQTPFTNITMDLTAQNAMRNIPVYIAGEDTQTVYGDYQREMDLINRAFADIMLEGDANHKVFPFPIPTYNVTKDFNWDNPVLEPVWEMTAKYGIPYFSNFINSDMKPDDARSMCCRLRLDNRELRRRGGGLFGAYPMTGSIGVVTINMPRLGFLSKDRDDLLTRLDKLMDLARESLEIKRKVLEQLTEANLYPYSKFYLRAIKEDTGHYWNNHFNTIGINGMNECLLNLIGKGIATPEGLTLAQDIMNHMRARLVDYQEKSDLLYNLEATPAEGVTYRFARADKDRFGGAIICANQDNVENHAAEPYYTNSSQLPVGYTDDIFEALDLQDPLQTLYTGGTVLHGFLGEAAPGGESVKRLVRKIAENYRLPYFTITPTFSICPIHGYIPGAHEFCPLCDAELEAKAAAKKAREARVAALSYAAK